MGPRQIILGDPQPPTMLCPGAGGWRAISRPQTELHYDICVIKLVTPAVRRCWVSKMAIASGHQIECELELTPVRSQPNCNRGRLTYGAGRANPCPASVPEPMKIASFNINNINRRLANLLGWLREAEPDIVCLQELKSADTEFPADAIRRAGYHAVWRGEKRWNGVAILARWTPVVTRLDLPGDAADGQCRYLEAAIKGVLVASIYAPNGNPQPGPKFDYKLAWLERLNAHAAELYATGTPVALAGDYNIVPTDLDIYPTKSWDRDALLQPQSRAAYQHLSRRAGPTPFARSIPKNRCTRSGITCGRAGNATAVSASTKFY